MKKHLISVIIPVYDIEQEYLATCFKSIVENGYDNYEVLVVNDSSKNFNTRKFLNEFTNNNNRFRLINLTGLNKGPGYARNIGLEHASGEIVVYIDGDDYVLSGMLNRINEIFNQYPNLDIFSFANKMLMINGMINQTNHFIFNTNEPVSVDTWPDALKDKPSVWAKAYAKSFLVNNKIKFINEDTYMEDLCYFFLTFAYAKNIMFKNEVFYILRENVNSRALSTFSFNKLKSLFLGLMKTYDQIKDLDSYITKNYKMIFNELWKKYSSLVEHDEQFNQFSLLVNKFKQQIK